MNIRQHIMICVLFLCTCYSFQSPVYAQETNKVDSLKRLVTQKKDTSLVNLWNKIALQYRSFSLDSALHYSQMALTEAERLQYEQGQADALLEKGRIKRAKGSYTTALEDMFSSLKLYEKVEDSVQIGNAYNDISIVYGLSQDYEKSRHYFEKALELFHQTGDSKGESYALNNIGAIYEEEGNLPKAKEYYLNSLTIKKQRNDVYGVARGYYTLGELARKQEKYQEAIEHFSQADSLFKISNDLLGAAYNVDAIAKTYFDLGLLAKGRKYALRSYQYGQALKNNRSIQLALGTLSKICAAQNDYKSAYEYHIKLDQITDSLREASNDQHLAELKADFDDEQQKTEITLLKQEKQIQSSSIFQQKTIILALIFCIIVIVGFAIALSVANASSKQKNILLASKNEEIQQQAYILSDQKSRLEQINKTKDKLFSIISHDIRSPLNTLKGFSYLLMQDINVMEKAEMQQMGSRINIALDNLSQLLDNLLNWSLMQTGNKKLEFTHINISELINFNIALYEATAQEKNITLINESDAKVYAYADYQSINTILRNILSNSIKFSYSDSSIEIQAKTADDLIELVIVDHGTGMTEDTMSRIFSIDKKESQMGTKNETGSGFGLTLCHELVTQNKGKIQIFSKLKEGTRFVVTLPASQDLRTSKEQDSHQS